MNRCLILLGLALLGSGIHAQPVLKIAAQPDMEAYYSLLTVIYAEMGFKAEITSMAEELSLQVADSGEYDAMAGVGGDRLSAYPDLRYTTEPVIESTIQAWAKKGSAVAITIPADLKNYSVCIIRGEKYAKDFTAGLGVRVDSVTMNTMNRYLSRGYIEVGILSSDFVTPDLAETNYAFAPQLMTVRSFHVFNKKHAGLVPKFDAILKAMRADGRYQELLSDN